ncbi:MAG: hypothetical protein AABY22_34510 [Nanoarchaeota archaeon]
MSIATEELKPKLEAENEELEKEIKNIKKQLKELKARINKEVKEKFKSEKRQTTIILRAKEKQLNSNRDVLSIIKYGKVMKSAKGKTKENTIQGDN